MNKDKLEKINKTIDWWFITIYANMISFTLNIATVYHGNTIIFGRTSKMAIIPVCMILISVIFIEILKDERKYEK